MSGREKMLRKLFEDIKDNKITWEAFVDTINEMANEEYLEGARNERSIQYWAEKNSS
jgi:hypothetical protein